MKPASSYWTVLGQSLIIVAMAWSLFRQPQSTAGKWVCIGLIVACLAVINSCYLLVRRQALQAARRLAESAAEVSSSSA